MTELSNTGTLGYSKQPIYHNGNYVPDRRENARKERNLHCDVQVTLKTNTHYRTFCLWTRSGSCDRIDPDVAIKTHYLVCSSDATNNLYGGNFFFV